MTGLIPDADSRPDASDLRRLQMWLLCAITNPAEASGGCTAEVLLPSRQQTAAERLAVYQQAYLARLLEVLRELFPCLRSAVGDELFDVLAAEYIEQHPPASYTLGRLADHWVAYLDRTRPPDFGRFVVELAQLEQEIDQVFDGPGPERLPPFELPERASGELRLRLVPGFRLLAFEYPVSTYFTAWKQGQSPEWPPPQAQHVALFRREYIVRRHELTSVQYDLLSRLAVGQSLGAALEQTAAAPDAPTIDVLAVSCRDWFCQWAAAGFFAAAQFAPDSDSSRNLLAGP
jgi:hypothetical protein